MLPMNFRNSTLFSSEPMVESGAPRLDRRALLALAALMASGLSACGGNTDPLDLPLSNGLDGVVTTMAGSTRGFMDGSSTEARFDYPWGVAMDTAGNLYVGDSGNHKIRKITPAGVVSTLAGSTAGTQNGVGSAAQFNTPLGVAVDASGNVYVSDRYYGLIRKITPAGEVSTLAGSTQGYQDGPGQVARFQTPYGIALDASGHVYVADLWNHMIRKITQEGVVSTLAGSTGGYQDGPALTAQFNRPSGVAVDRSGNVYVTDVGNTRIRKISTDCVVSTLAGSSTQGYVDGTGPVAQFTSLTSLAVDASGTLYVCDGLELRRVTAEGVVTTLAGASVAGEVDATGTAARFRGLAGIAIDASGHLYVADGGNQKIRKIS